MAVNDQDYSFFGVSAVYTPDGGSPASVTAVVSEEPELDADGRVVRHKTLISVRQSEVSARPGYRDTFVLNDGAGTSQTWTIVDDGVREAREVSDLGGEWECECSRQERPIL